MFNPVSPNPPSAQEVISGVLLAMVGCYVLFNIPDFLRGDFTVDLGVVRLLLFVGVLVMGFAWWEGRRGSKT